MKNIHDLAFEFDMLSKTLASELSRNSAKSIAEALLPLSEQLQSLEQQFIGERLQAEQQAAVQAVVKRFAPLKTRADGFRRDANEIMHAAMPKNPYSREDLAEIRAGLRPGIVSQNAVGLPSFDHVKLNGMLEAATASGQLNVVWAIMNSPENWISPETKQATLLSMVPEEKRQVAESLLYDANEFEAQYNRLQNALS